jgi:ribosome modulation factor
VPDIPELKEQLAYQAGFAARLRGEPEANAPAYTAYTLDAREAWLQGWRSAAGYDAPEILRASAG